MGDLSANFSTSEFACKDCGRCKIDGRLIVALQQLRNLGSEPIFVDDGYRCPEHNKEVGGVSGSQHQLGTAADIRIEGLSVQSMYDRAKSVDTFYHGGIGVYDGGFIHVDVRDGAARWARVKDKYLALNSLVNP